VITLPPRRCPHVVVVVGLVRLCDAGSNAGGSLTTMPVRSKGRVHTKRDTLVFQDGGWAWGYQPHPVKNKFVQKPYTRWRLVLEEANAQPGL
jgi:hypothetical protein